jgi:hypothetical protein
MALNIKKLTDRLQAFKDGEKASEFAKYLWKPKEGSQTIRIVPYMVNPENPFIELKFYYKIGGNNYLAPCTFGKPDPIMDAIDALRAGGSNEEKETAAKLAPVTRTYVPVIVRGEEELGVRYWGFGIQVYKQLLKLMTNAKYGDITSYTDGRDIEVEFHKESKKKNAKGQSFPETNILADPATSPAVDPKRRDLLEKLRDQADIMNIFPLKSYEELKAAVEKWLNPEDVEPTDDVEPVSPTTVTTPSVNDAESKTPKAPSSDEAVADEFDKFFAR